MHKESIRSTRRTDGSWESSTDSPQIVGCIDIPIVHGFAERSTLIQATDHAVSLVYDTPPELRAQKGAELGEQLVRLHDGWGIRYPAALLTKILQKDHGRDFFLPPLTTRVYAGNEEDTALAVSFGAKGLEGTLPMSDAVSMGLLVQSLYDEAMTISFCIDGAQSPTIEQPTFVPQDGIFQDVGQP